MSITFSILISIRQQTSTQSDEIAAKNNKGHKYVPALVTPIKRNVQVIWQILPQAINTFIYIFVNWLC